MRKHKESVITQLKKLIDEKEFELKFFVELDDQ